MTAALFETAPVVVVDTWTGRDAAVLRAALRLTNEAFADRLGVAVRTVANWNARPGLVPVPELQRVLDTALTQAPVEAKHRFWMLANTNTYTAGDAGGRFRGR